MRRLIAFTLLFLHLGLFTELKEVMRLPLLVEHYFEHQALAPEISFVQFLVMHYETDVPHDATDMKLPFKDCQHCVATMASAVPAPHMGLTPDMPEGSLSFHTLYISFIPTTGLDEIFQPPRA